MEQDIKREPLNIPPRLKISAGGRTSPVYFMDIRGRNLDLNSRDVQDELNGKIRIILEELIPGSALPPALIKIHPGEPKARTGILPELVKSQITFLKDKGLTPVIGDSTVLYTGGRSCKNNPPDDVSAYMKVAGHNRWSQKHTGVPFVIIDRPLSSVPGVFEFEEEEVFKKVDSPGSYSGVFVSGGLEKANVIFNNAHLTMHGLSPIALSVKGIAMGGAGVSGKKQMHMNLTPNIDSGICSSCGLCIENCPFDALYAGDGDVPVLSAARCAGCGECMAVCPNSAITISREGRIEWGRGTDSFLRRLSDFTVSMMNGKWDKLINIGHLYQITAQCDCMNIAQKPIIGDIGVIVSRNPFAADMLAAELFSEQARHAKKHHPLKDYTQSFGHIEETYGIRVRPEIIKR